MTMFIAVHPVWRSLYFKFNNVNIKIILQLNLLFFAWG